MLSDVIFAFRKFSKIPVFTGVIVLSLAIGIGATTTVYSWIQGILLRPIPGAEHQERLVALVSVLDKQTSDTVSLPDLKDYRDLNSVFSGVIGSQVTPACLTIDQANRWFYGQITTANFFEILGVRPLLGRTFLPDEDQKPGGNPVVVLSESSWALHLHSDPTIIGKLVKINQHQFTVIGIVPSSFHGSMNGIQCDFWVPISMYKEVITFGSLEQRSYRWLHSQARLQPNVLLADAQIKVDTVGERLEQSYPESNRLVRMKLVPYSRAPYGVGHLFEPVFSILFIISVSVLAIVAANVASLLLALATARKREIALRLALGASRPRVMRQLITENIILALIGGSLGVLLSIWTTHLLTAWLPHTYLPLSLSTDVGTGTLGFASMITIITGIIFGLVPAWQLSGLDLNASIKQGGRVAGPSASEHRLRSVLVAIEIALAFAVLVAAGLCVKSLWAARNTDLGFKPDHVLIVGLRAGMNGYNESTVGPFYEHLQEHMNEMPGVQSAALSSWFPLGFDGGSAAQVNVEGAEQRIGEDHTYGCSIISRGYFQTLGIQLLEGRDFTDRDDGSALPVVVINESMARKFWPGTSAIGRHIDVWGKSRTVVGVVKTGKYRSLNEEQKGFFYLPYRQHLSVLDLGVCIRTTGNPDALSNLVRKEIHNVDPQVEVWTTISMEDFIQASYVAQILASRILSGLGLVVLGLAAIGIYGVMAFIVRLRRTDFAVRIALGAQKRDIVGLVLARGLKLAGTGLALGLFISLGLSRLMSSFLFGLSAFDARVLFVSLFVLCLVTLLASCMPAYWASKLRADEVLRCE